MTTTAVPDTDPAGPRKGLDDPTTASGDVASLSDLITGTALADTNPTSTPLAVSAGLGPDTGRNGTNNNNGGRNGDRNRGNGNNPGNRNKDNGATAKEKAQDPIEPVLISVGSIGRI